MELQFAPIQGYTDAAYRRVHNETYPGGIACYYTPFIRVEKNDVRPKDLREIDPALNHGLHIIPQILVNSVAQFNFLCDKISANGYTEIDVNMGCPFPPQTRKGGGAALLSRPDTFAEIMAAITRRNDISFSIKMRLGLNECTQWKQLAPAINDTPLRQVAIHPRIATQQYKGEINLTEFDAIYDTITHPLVYNGDITTISQICDVSTKYPRLKGIMMGRGLLARPSLAQEYISGVELTTSQRLAGVRQMHDSLFDYYCATLHGETQILLKMKTFWDYLEPLIGHKIAKTIHKSSTISKYNTAVAMI